MKYKIELNRMQVWWCVSTNFAITPTLRQLIGLCKGVSVFAHDTDKRYHVDFTIGEMFEVEEVKANLSKILDAYIEANPNAGQAEDKEIKAFATDNEQYNFLKNY